MINRIVAALPYATAAAAIVLLLAIYPSDPGGTRKEAAASDAGSRTALGMVVTWAKTVKARLRHPESLQWDTLLANQDGSVVCLAYRARGDNGDLTSERVAFVSGRSGPTQAPWEQACTRDLAVVADAERWIEMR